LWKVAEEKSSAPLLRSRSRKLLNGIPIKSAKNHSLKTIRSLSRRFDWQCLCRPPSITDRKIKNSARGRAGERERAREREREKEHDFTSKHLRIHPSKQSQSFNCQLVFCLVFLLVFVLVFLVLVVNVVMVAVLILVTS
jgi:Flp pilus assembly protein TadB